MVEQALGDTPARQPGFQFALVGSPSTDVVGELVRLTVDLEELLVPAAVADVVKVRRRWRRWCWCVAAGSARELLEGGKEAWHGWALLVGLGMDAGFVHDGADMNALRCGEHHALALEGGQADLAGVEHLAGGGGPVEGGADEVGVHEAQQDAVDGFAGPAVGWRLEGLPDVAALLAAAPYEGEDLRACGVVLRLAGVPNGGEGIGAALACTVDDTFPGVVVGEVEFGVLTGDGTFGRDLHSVAQAPFDDLVAAALEDARVLDHLVQCGVDVGPVAVAAGFHAALGLDTFRSGELLRAAGLQYLFGGKVPGDGRLEGVGGPLG